MAVTTSPGQVHAFMITERVASIFSMLGILFILSTFLLGRGFDKPINRLIFFASWSNLGMNIASLIATDGILAGQNSSLCQFQAWAVQMFLGVDVFWALCMAFNVYLALFRGWTASRMRAQEWKYFVGCYGASLVPAVTYLGIHTQSRGKVYGPALLWCWVSPSWDFLRIATLYGIVWIAILFAFVIYTMAFAKVWRHRHELRGLFNPFNENPFAHTIVTTEIDITSAPMPAPSSESRAEVTRFKEGTFDTTSKADAAVMLGGDRPKRNFDSYSVDVEAGARSDGRTRIGDARRPSTKPEVFKMRTLTRDHALQETNPDAWLYARVAFLFFCALLISWVPASINRLYSIVHPDILNFGLNYTETLVLPLQGFWNAVVYIVASQTACRNLWRSFCHKPEISRKDSYVGQGRGLDLDAQGTSGKGIGMGILGANGRHKGSGDVWGGKMDRFVSRREAQRLSGERNLHSSDSVAGLTKP